MKDLIVDEVRRNRRQITELQRDLSGLDMPSHAPESTIWSTLCSGYLATTPDVVLPALNADIARIDRLLTEYRRALQQGPPPPRSPGATRSRGSTTLSSGS